MLKNYNFAIVSRKLTQHFGIIRSVMLNLVIVNVGNSLRTRISIVVLTLIAWAAIVTSASMVSYDLQVKSVAYSSRFFIETINV